MGSMGTAIYLHVTSKGVRFVDANRSREGSERAIVELSPIAVAVTEDSRCLLGGKSMV